MVAVMGILPKLQNTITEGNVQKALALLNARGSSRFTSIFAFDEPDLKRVYLFDRQHPDQQHEPAVMPISSSYCDFVNQSGKTFIVTDSLNDPRVDGHDKQNIFRSYLGVPIKNADGTLWGTICYFDAEPNSFNPEQVDVLLQAAEILKSSSALH